MPVAYASRTRSTHFVFAQRTVDERTNLHLGNGVDLERSKLDQGILRARERRKRQPQPQGDRNHPPTQ